MRTEKEMYDLILNTAINDERIIAVTIGGSRVNKNVNKDIFQDYDICYIVRDIKSFSSDENWLKRFGDFLIIGKPDKEDYLLYLMQFTDGNRIDLSIYPKELSQKIFQKSLIKVLLDKENIFPEIEEASDRDFHLKKPTYREFFQTCNEFWWVCPYVAKGLWRGETLFALEFLENHVRSVLMRMFGWYAGVNNSFSLSVGKANKYLHKYISKELYKELLMTYTNAESENIWDSLFSMCRLFSTIAADVSEKLNFEYNDSDERNVTEFINHIYNLPKDAKEIYQ